MSVGRVDLTVTGDVATIRIDRPEARGAMTMGMYAELSAICERLRTGPRPAAVLLRGTEGAFVAGTDIAEFAGMATGQDGLAYESGVEAVIEAVEALPAPTVAVIDGPAMGGGLILAAACDFRLLSPRSRLGVPIARTVGNCLSLRNLARLERVFGAAATRRMLLLAETISPEEAMRLGVALDVHPVDAINEALETLLDRLRAGSPTTIEASRLLLRRLGAGDWTDGDVIEAVYSSPSFHEGVRAFLGKRTPDWTAIVPRSEREK